MRRLFRLPVWVCLGLTLGLLLFAASAANADLTVNNIGLYAGGTAPIDPSSTIVEIQFTGNNGIWVYGDAQTATNWTYADGSSIPLYCIDLVHDNYLGSSYNLANWTNPSSFSSDALNRVAWAAENATLSGYSPAATQLLMWSVIDPGFKVINWNGANSLETAYNTAVTAMNNSYNPSKNYESHVEFLDAVHEPQSNLNQDLVVTALPGGIQIGAQGVPEPSSFVIAGLGALGLIGYGWRRSRAGCGSRRAPDDAIAPVVCPEVSQQS